MRAGIRVERTRSRLARLALARVAIVVTVGGTAGAMQGCCGDCAGTGGWVSVPAARASDVASVTVTGACAAIVRCASPSMSPCTGYSISPQHEGICHIEVTFASGAAPITRDFDFRWNLGCCSGPYSVSGSAYVQVPEVVGDAAAGGG